MFEFIKLFNKKWVHYLKLAYLDNPDSALFLSLTITPQTCRPFVIR